MIQCPMCQTDLGEQDFGLVTCPGCNASLMIDLEGSVTTGEKTDEPAAESKQGQKTANDPNLEKSSKGEGPNDQAADDGSLAGAESKADPEAPKTSLSEQMLADIEGTFSGSEAEAGRMLEDDSESWSAEGLAGDPEHDASDAVNESLNHDFNDSEASSQNENEASGFGSFEDQYPADQYPADQHQEGQHQEDQTQEDQTQEESYQEAQPEYEQEESGEQQLAVPESSSAEADSDYEFQEPFTSEDPVDSGLSAAHDPESSKEGALDSFDHHDGDYEQGPEVEAHRKESSIDEIGEYGNSESSQKGSFRYTLIIKSIDSRDTKEDLKAILSDKRLMLDADEVLSSVANGELTIENLSSVKAYVILSQLIGLPLDLEWSQHVDAHA